jgi:hypothetical protein
VTAPRRRAAALGAIVVLAAAGCDAERLPSPPARLEGPRVWAAGDGESWISPTELGPDTLSITIVATAPATTPSADLLSLSVRDRAGRVLVDPADPEQSLNRLLPGHGLLIGALPSSTAALPLAPNYAVSAVPASGVTLSAWVKRAPQGLVGVPAVQALSVALLRLDRGRASGPSLEAALDQLRQIWRPAGIEIAVAERREGTGPPWVRVDPTLGSESPLVGEALRATEGIAAGTLPVVVVDELVLGGSDLSLWALSGAIPVPPVNGTPRSGVVVSGALIERDPFFAGQVLAHEVGHALGLYHTTERFEAGTAVSDQITDTPACPASADVHPPDGALDEGECARYDAANLMFWSAPRGATLLTPLQAEMARRSALVR